MGRAIVVADGVATKSMRIPNGAAPDEINDDGPNHSMVFTGHANEVSYAFLASWSLDGTITSWPQFQQDVEHLQTELSHPVRITAVPSARKTSLNPRSHQQAYSLNHPAPK
jgi:hypothetical protein